MLCGFALHQIPLGEKWENASYDYLFRFGSHAATNVVLITMDNSAYQELHQARGQTWDRSLHAKLLQKLADDQASLVVLDVFLGDEGASKYDVDLAAAMRRQGHVVLMEKMAEPKNPKLETYQILSPQSIFAQAAAGLGVAWFAPGKDDDIVRQHWPFPSSAEVVSLSWAAATNSGA